MRSVPTTPYGDGTAPTHCRTGHDRCSSGRAYGRAETHGQAYRRRKSCGRLL